MIYVVGPKWFGLVKGNENYYLLKEIIKDFLKNCEQVCYNEKQAYSRSSDYLNICFSKDYNGCLYEFSCLAMKDMSYISDVKISKSKDGEVLFNEPIEKINLSSFLFIELDDFIKKIKRRHTANKYKLDVENTEKL